MLGVQIKNIETNYYEVRSRRLLCKGKAADAVANLSATKLSASPVPEAIDSEAVAEEGNHVGHHKQFLSNLINVRWHDDSLSIVLLTRYSSNFRKVICARHTVIITNSKAPKRTPDPISDLGVREIELTSEFMK